MNRYEGLFILNTAGREEGLKDAIDKISAEIASAGGKVENVQKMDKRAFARTPHKKVTSGFYVNVIFTAPGKAIRQLHGRFVLDPEVYRVQFTVAPEPAETPAVATAAGTR